MSQMQSDDLKSEELRHLQAVNKLDEDHRAKLNDIDIVKDIEKKQSAEEYLEYDWLCFSFCCFSCGVKVSVN